MHNLEAFENGRKSASLRLVPLPSNKGSVSLDIPFDDDSNSPSNRSFRIILEIKRQVRLYRFFQAKHQDKAQVLRLNVHAGH